MVATATTSTVKSELGEGTWLAGQFISTREQHWEFTAKDGKEVNLDQLVHSINVLGRIVEVSQNRALPNPVAGFTMGDKICLRVKAFGKADGFVKYSLAE